MGTNWWQEPSPCLWIKYCKEPCAQKELRCKVAVVVVIVHAVANAAVAVRENNNPLLPYVTWESTIKAKVNYDIENIL